MTYPQQSDVVFQCVIVVILVHEDGRYGPTNAGAPGPIEHHIAGNHPNVTGAFTARKQRTRTSMMSTGEFL